MKCVLVYLIKGEAESYQQMLVKIIGPKFGENYMVENPLPAHVTLKSPFQCKNMKELEEFMEDFSSKQKKSKIKIRGFGNFDKKVVFLKTKFSSSGKKIQKELIKKYSKKFNYKPHEFELKFKPHSTIAYGNTRENFKKIWKEIKKLKKPKFDLEFDNITILKKPKKYWKIHKEFKIK